MGSVRFRVQKIRRRPWPSATRVRPASIPARTPRGARTPTRTGRRVAWPGLSSPPALTRRTLTKRSGPRLRGGRRTPLIAYAPSLSCAPPRLQAATARPAVPSVGDRLGLRRALSAVEELAQRLLDPEATVCLEVLALEFRKPGFLAVTPSVLILEPDIACTPPLRSPFDFVGKRRAQNRLGAYPSDGKNGVTHTKRKRANKWS